MFQCSSASRKFLNSTRSGHSWLPKVVSVLFSEPKIPQHVSGAAAECAERAVSVLFSEPKIPQPRARYSRVAPVKRFSALQRAENSSTELRDVVVELVIRFQCSSASRKFLNRCGCSSTPQTQRVSVLFSEPKIPQPMTHASHLFVRVEFQCSSASRKFLNAAPTLPRWCAASGFSALQRAENSSTTPQIDKQRHSHLFQCSSASRKFLNLQRPNL